MTDRYEAHELKRPIKGLRAVIIDTRHPSGVKNVEVLFCKTLEDAQKQVDEVNPMEKWNG